MSEPMIIGEVTVVRRDWPKHGQSLYSVTNEADDIHMSYVDVPGGNSDAAILMSINPKTETITILAVKQVADEEAALKWYIEERLERRKN